MSEIRRTDANSREVRAIELIAGLDARLNNDEKYIEERLRSVPGLWRKYRIAKAFTERVIDGLYATLTPRVLLRLQRLCTNGEIVFRPRSPLNASTDTHIVLESDLKKLVNTAMCAECAMCLKCGSEIKNCELRKTLVNVAPPSKIAEGSSLCEYSSVAVNSEYGDYI